MSIVCVLFFLSLSYAAPALYCLNLSYVDLSVDRGYTPNPLSCNCPDTPLVGYYAALAPDYFLTEYPGQITFKCICATSLEKFEWNDSPCRQVNMATNFNCSEFFYFGCTDPTGTFATVWLQDNPTNFGMYLTNTIKNAMLGSFNVAWSFVQLGTKSTIAPYVEPWGALGITSHGCFQDNVNSRILPFGVYSSTKMDTELCAFRCRGTYQYFGMTNGNQCYCGSSLPSATLKTTGCTTPCTGSSRVMCGGTNRVSVYQFDTPPPTSWILPRSGTINAGSSISSPSGLFVLGLTTNGILRLTYSNGTVIWQSNNAGSTATPIFFTLQSDSNLVIYAATGALWGSGTVNRGGTSLKVQDDGNLVLYNDTGFAVWATNTSVATDSIPQVVNSPAFTPFLPTEPLLSVDNTGKNFNMAMIRCASTQLRHYMVLMRPARFFVDVAPTIVYYRCLTESRAKEFWQWAGSPNATAITLDENPVQPAGLYTLASNLYFGFQLNLQSNDCMANFYTFQTNCGPGNLYPDVELYAAPVRQSSNIYVLSTRPFDSVTCQGSLTRCTGSYQIQSQTQFSTTLSLSVARESGIEIEKDINNYVTEERTFKLTVSAGASLTRTTSRSDTYTLDYDEPMNSTQSQLVIYFAKQRVVTNTDVLFMIFPSGTIYFQNPMNSTTFVPQTFPLDFFYPVSKAGIGFPLKMSSQKFSDSYLTCIPKPPTVSCIY